MVRALSLILAVLAAIMLVASLVSLIPSNRGAIRMLDMVRQPTLYLAALFAVLSLFAAKRWRWWLVGSFALVAAIQLWRIWAYMPFAEEQVALRGTRQANCFTALSLNVQMGNTDHARVAALIRRVNPDVLFLMETDAQWLAALREVLAAYPNRVLQPQDNYYGLAFATRLPLVRARTVEKLSDNTPTLYAMLVAPGGTPFEFIGLHPRPPLPGQGTAARDLSILGAGIETPDRLPNALVMGDFNDVPWSRTTTLFRQGGGWRDPRLGRGTHQTFPADFVWAGYPLDHLMVKNGLEIASFAVLGDAGSDHRPVSGRLCMGGS